MFSSPSLTHLHTITFSDYFQGMQPKTEQWCQLRHKNMSSLSLTEGRAKVVQFGNVKVPLVGIGRNILNLIKCMVQKNLQLTL